MESEDCLPQLGRQGEGSLPVRQVHCPPFSPQRSPSGDQGSQPAFPRARSRRVLPGCVARCRLDPRPGSPALPSLILAPRGPSSRLGQPPRLVGFRMTSQRRAGPFPRARGGDQIPPRASPSFLSLSSPLLLAPFLPFPSFPVFSPLSFAPSPPLPLPSLTLMVP